MEQRPTWTLTERTPVEVALSADDVDFLLTRHRAAVQLLPTRQPGVFRVTPTGHVGTILAPDCRLVLRPKIPLRNVLYLLDADAELPALTDESAATSDEMIDLLAAQFARRLAERVAAGLRRGYRERAEVGAFLLGRLDVAAQLRDLHGRKDQLHCRFDDFTADVPCNQLARAVAERVLAWPLLDPAVRHALRHTLTAFAEVQTVPLDGRSFDGVLADRLQRDYWPLLTLGRLLAESLTPTPAGPLAGPAFLLNLERLFERFLLSRIAACFDPTTADVRAVVQPWCPVEARGGLKPELALRPDLTLRRADRTVLVLDAKWKRLPATRLVTADVYQILAYCAALDVRRAMLVYPGRRDRAWDYELGALPMRLTVRTLCVTGDRARLERSVRRLLRALRRDALVE